MQRSRKIVVLGHFGVGKTSLIRKEAENILPDNYKHIKVTTELIKIRS